MGLAGCGHRWLCFEVQATRRTPPRPARRGQSASRVREPSGRRARMREGPGAVERWGRLSASRREPTCTTPAAKPAAPPRKARADAFFITSPKVIFFFSSVAALPASWPTTGMGEAARSAAVKPAPAVMLASAGRGRAESLNPRRFCAGMRTVSVDIRAVVRSRYDLHDRAAIGFKVRRHGPRRTGVVPGL